MLRKKIFIIFLIILLIILGIIIYQKSKYSLEDVRQILINNKNLSNNVYLKEELCGENDNYLGYVNYYKKDNIIYISQYSETGAYADILYNQNISKAITDNDILKFDANNYPDYEILGDI